MSHEWETGFMVRTPSWHGLERAVLKNSPTTWEAARKEADLTWEVETEPVYIGTHIPPEIGSVVTPITDWQAVTRNDKEPGTPERLLAIQKSSYHIIRNSQFGEIIDTVLGLDEDKLLDERGEVTGDDFVNFEALFSLYGGRQIVALCYFDKPLQMDWDPSKTYRYLSLSSRHDGQGGLRGIPTNVRVQCANTLNLAEMMDGRAVGFSIRHTSNWEHRLAEVSRSITAARGESAKWLKFAEQLALYKVNARQRETYLKKYLPVSDDMGRTQANNVIVARSSIRNILEGETCAGIADTGYGLLMASTEWSDHYRTHNSTDSLINRQLLRKEEPKARASRVLRHMAGIKN